MLQLIVPAGVETEEHFGEVPSGGTLFPGEEAVIARAVSRRRREFTAGRGCARAGMERLGYPPVAILPGVGGAPAWPPGLLGSITHCSGYVAAAVGHSTLLAAIGIDAEPDAPLPEGVLDVIATPAEREEIVRMRRAPGEPHWDRLLFSAKESVYKAWFPAVGKWLDHQEAEIRFEPESGSFTAVLSRDGLVIDGQPVTRLKGRWISEQGILLTAVAVSR